MQDEPVGPAVPDRTTAALDIVIVIAVSVIAYLVEGLALGAGWLELEAQARGVSAVLAGVVAALALVWARGDSLRDLGFRRPRRWRTVPLWVLGILVAFIVAQNGVPILASLFIDLPPPDLSRHNPIAGNAAAALRMALVLPFTASIPEELLYRGFLIDRLTRILGSDRRGAALTVLVQALIFGAAHLGWGLGGIFLATIMGLVWGTAFLLCGRNLWIVILAHTTAHLLFVAQLYGSSPG